MHMHDTPMKVLAEAINITCYTTNKIFLGPGTRRHLMNYRLEKDLTLSILGLLEMSVIYLGIGKPWKV